MFLHMSPLHLLTRRDRSETRGVHADLEIAASETRMLEGVSPGDFRKNRNKRQRRARNVAVSSGLTSVLHPASAKSHLNQNRNNHIFAVVFNPRLLIPRSLQYTSPLLIPRSWSFGAFVSFTRVSGISLDESNKKKSHCIHMRRAVAQICDKTSRLRASHSFCPRNC